VSTVASRVLPCLLCLVAGCGPGVTTGRCGDGEVQPGEPCDGVDFGGASCKTLGFGSGSLTCTADCTLRVHGCISEGFVPLEAGAFTMGSPDDEVCRGDNETRHPVTLTRGLEVSATEVTQGQYEELMGYNPAAFSSTEPGCGEHCRCGSSTSCRSHPVELVSWHEAAAYCSALSAARGLSACYTCSGSGPNISCVAAAAHAGAAIYDCPGYRLPTEAEWEWAYRAGTRTAFYSGDPGITPQACMSCTERSAALESIGWYCANAAGSTHPVGEKKPNAWGLYDMAGNVYEWCHDSSPDPPVPLGTKAVSDPWGPASGPFRVIRGGSWYAPARLARAANRGPFARPTHRTNGLGLRCVRTLSAKQGQ
jgi:formylglycine-generating enzyme required for sulfatase activity